MIILKSPSEIAAMRVAGSILAAILEELRAMIRPGVSLFEIDKRAEQKTQYYKAIPAFKGYNGFPASICASVNEEVVHGIPGNRVLKSGDIIGLDFGVVFNNFYADSAITVPVGQVSPEVDRLIQVTEKALYLGIHQAKPGNRLYDISGAIQQYVESNGFSVVRDFVGHGIGRKMHESPQIPNFVGNDYNPVLKTGMALAIEPMVNIGTYEVDVDTVDNWTVRTADQKYSAHFEHTVAVTETEPEILTLLRPELLPEV
ncbi:MAG TPA: type I methionyl aminopeptidase [Firmicutes bacterium]|jgi:methionyl aminopeptidase|nr:type I methionyl aminopeptidase [Bacillota bacterium]